MKKKFKDLGKVVVTKAVWAIAADEPEFHKFMLKCLDRYSHCDWGEMADEDISMNHYAADQDERILASYNFPDDILHVHGDGRLWIITEWDRSVTTILLPSDY